MIEMECLEFFPTLIAKFDNFLSENQCKDIISYYNSDLRFKDHDLISKGYSNYGADDFLKEITEKIESCNNFSIALWNCIYNYSTTSGFPVKYIINSWINCQKKDSMLFQHTHPKCMVSGVLYLYVDDDSSKIHFRNPNPIIHYLQTDDVPITKYSSDGIFFTPKIGTLLIFPSWIEHGSKEPNKSEERYAFSFNVV